MKKDSTSFSLPDGMIRRFKSECSLRGITMSTVVAEAVESWLARPLQLEEIPSAGEEGELSVTQKHLTVDLTPAKNKGELVGLKVIAYETLHTSNPCQSEISLLTQILESGTDAYAGAIRASLQALARAVQIERGGSGKDTGNAWSGVDPRTPKDTGEPKATGGSNSKAQQLVDSVNEDFAEAERGKPAIVPRKKRSGGDGK